jgi:hypothetical protein
MINRSKDILRIQKLQTDLDAVTAELTQVKNDLLRSQLAEQNAVNELHARRETQTELYCTACSVIASLKKQLHELSLLVDKLR